MRARLTGAVAGLAVGLSAAFAPAVLAQDPVPTPTTSPSPTPTPSATPTPTATPSPTPTPEEQKEAARDKRDRRSKGVRRIYRDFERDGRIDDCDHTLTALKRARRSIADSYAEDFPDFRDALTAAIERHKDGNCVEATPTPSATATPAPTSSPGSTAPPPSSTQAPVPPPSSSPESGALPDFGAGGSGGGTGGSGNSGGAPGTIPAPGEDAIPEGTPSPTPAPAPLPPKLVVTRAATDTNLFVPGTMLAIALVGLLIAGLSALAAKRTGRLQGVDQAWREAAWRVSGTWSDFADWLRRR